MNKIAVCVPPARCDCYGHLSRYAEQIAVVGAARAIDVEILRYAAGDFFTRLFANLADENCIVHFHSYLYDLRTVAVAAGLSFSHVLEGSRATTLATISDHPFTDFMQDMVRGAHPTTKFVVVDDSFPDEMRFINPSLRESAFTHLPFVPPVNFDPALVMDFADRPYDLVLPIFLTDLPNDLRALIAALPQSWLTRAGLATYEIARDDLRQNPFHIFARFVSEQLGGTLDDIRIHQPKVMPALLNMMHSVDGVIRQERRHKMVRSLLRSTGDLKILAMAQPVASLDLDDKVTFVGCQSFAGAANLMAKSKAILNCNPTYPTNIHERISVGMMYESCVITDLNPCIEANFSAEQYVPYGPGFKMTIADIFDTYDVEGIASAGAADIRTRPHFSWDAHFNALLSIAHA